MSRRLAVVLVMVVALAYGAVLWRTAPEVGFTRDEGYYFKAAEEYARWWEVLGSRRFLQAFSDDEIKRHFSYNTEHPPLVKLTLGATHALLHKVWSVASPSQAYRATGFLFGALTLIATYLLGAALVSRRVGVAAMLMMACIPRYFYDAHLACFDVPITAMWTLGLWAFWRARVSSVGERGRRRKIVVAGLVFGLGIATKLNAFFLPIIFTLVALWMVDTRSLRLARGPSGGRDLVLPPIPWELVSCAILGPVVFYVTWPYLWHHPIERTGAYIAFHLHHEHYPISYFHQLLVKPPFPVAFPFVMTLYTLPAPLLVLGTLGVVGAAFRTLRARWSALSDVAQGRDAGRELLLVLATMLPIVLIALPSTPIFGGVKHWFNAMPTLCIVGARLLWLAVDAVAPTLSESRAGVRHGAVALGLLALTLGPGFAGIAASHPNGIGYYNELAGGYRGAAELGMQRQFWGGLARPLYDQLDEVPRPGQVFFNRTNYDSYRMYQREKLIPADVYYGNSAKAGLEAGVTFEQPEHGETEGDLWSSLGTRPVSGVYQDNVVLNQLYVKGRSRQAP